MSYNVCFLVFLSCLLLLGVTFATNMEQTTIVIDVTRQIGEIDENFVCATLDWWPPEKCNYDQCPWGYASLINLNLSSPLLAKAIQAFKTLRIRIGGSLQDQVIYDVGDLKTPCTQFKKSDDGLFGFSEGWNDPKLVSRILDPKYLSGSVTGLFKNVERTVQENGPWASAWVGEAGGAFNSGGREVSETFINSFWYLDQFGMSSMHNTKVYCRQALVGGFYGLLEKETALLWHRLMGKGVLGIQTNASEYLRTYVHCSKGRAGITILLINLSKQTTFTVGFSNGVKVVLQAESTKRRSFLETIKSKVSWVGKKASDGYLNREEYHLSPKDGDLRSKIMMLNGNPLEPTVTGDIPKLEPVRYSVKSPVYINPSTISFIVLPTFDAPACS
ncbi:hypothetical protein F2Q69_00056562 [Brassica cretica]|uniref:Heparanase-like protein 2 n=1 Tax=Brassica cretica TaxID=69181 RepID=A0A8S9N4Z7_BRACR|nr:hypothetical protein F2Q69_00056562 [Brassica cretica]